MRRRWYASSSSGTRRWLSRLVHFSSGLLSCSLLRSAAGTWARSGSRCVEERVSCSGFSLGLGPSLHRLDGRYPRLRRLLRYYDLVRLLDACSRLAVSPSRACLPPTMSGEAPSRSPGSRAEGCCKRAELFDPGDWRESTSTIVGLRPWPSASFDRVGSPEDVGFEALSPGPLTRPPTLRPAGRPTLRKDWTSRGWTPPGVGLA